MYPNSYYYSSQQQQGYSTQMYSSSQSYNPSSYQSSSSLTSNYNVPSSYYSSYPYAYPSSSSASSTPSASFSSSTNVASYTTASSASSTSANTSSAYSTYPSYSSSYAYQPVYSSSSSSYNYPSSYPSYSSSSAYSTYSSYPSYSSSSSSSYSVNPSTNYAYVYQQYQQSLLRADEEGKDGAEAFDPDKRKFGKQENEMMSGQHAYHHGNKISNPARKMMQAMGYQEGKGLGKELQGPSSLKIWRGGSRSQRGLGFDKEEKKVKKGLIQCTLCCKFFSRLQPLEAHLTSKKHVLNVAQAQFTPFLRCMQCEVVCFSYDQLKQHLVETDHNIYKCEICHVGFTSKEEFDVHEKSIKHQKKRKQADDIASGKLPKKQKKSKDDTPSGPIPQSLSPRSQAAPSTTLASTSASTTTTTNGEVSSSSSSSSAPTPPTTATTTTATTATSTTESSGTSKYGHSQETEYFCEICHTHLSGPTPMEEHVKGKKHLRAMQAILDRDRQFVCEVCGLSLSGPAQFKDHIYGRRHIIAAKTRGLHPSITKLPLTNPPPSASTSAPSVSSPTSTSTAAMTSTPTPAPASPLLALSSSTSSSTSDSSTALPFRRSSSPLRSVSPTSLSSSSSGSSSTIDNQQPAQVEVFSLSPRDSSRPSYEPPAAPLPATFPSLFCSVCNVAMTSRENMEQHLNGRKHKATLKYSQKAASTAPTLNPNTLRCEYCNIQLSSQQTLQQHLKGKKHKMTVENIEGMNPPGGLNTRVKQEGQENGGLQHEEKPTDQTMIQNEQKDCMTEQENKEIETDIVLKKEPQDQPQEQLPIAQSQQQPEEPKDVVKQEEAVVVNSN